MSTKEIILKYNGYEIPIKISKDLEQCKEEIKKKLYLKELNPDKFSLFYFDDDGYENDIDEDSIEEAFEAKEWGLTQEEKKEDDDQTKKVNSEEINKKIKKKVDSEQKSVDERINKIKQEITEKLTKAFNDRISKYEEIIEKLKNANKSLKEKNKMIVEEMTKLHESSIQEILKNVQSYSQTTISTELENYNKMFNSELESAIKQNKEMIEKQNSNIKHILSSINQYNSNLQNSLRASKVNCRNIFENMNKK